MSNNLEIYKEMENIFELEFIRKEEELFFKKSKRNKLFGKWASSLLQENENDYINKIISLGVINENNMIDKVFKDISNVNNKISKENVIEKLNSIKY